MKLNQQLLGAAALMVAGFTTGHAQLIISEVHPTGSSSSTYAADWFELSNIGSASVNITGWKVDDDSASFGSALALRGVTSIAPGQSVIFLESNSSGGNDATIGAAFQSAWFGGSAPSGLTLGFYGGSGVGLSSGGDAVNIFDADGTWVVGVSFGAATSGTTFDNPAGLSGLISQLSVVGVNNAFNSVAGGEIGSPGVVPEPSMLALGALGFAAMLFRRKAAVR